jgi:nucleoid DNA-binding protein
MAAKKAGFVEAMQNKVHFSASAVTNAVALVFNTIKLTLGCDDTLEITGFERLPACRSDKPPGK